MKNKILIGIIVLIILVCVIALLLIVLNGNGKGNATNTVSNNNPNGEVIDNNQNQDTNSNVEETEVKTSKGSILISKKYYNSSKKDIVYEFLEVNIKEKEGDNTTDYTYKVPQFDLSSDEAKKINMEILDKYQEEVEDYIKENKKMNSEVEKLDYAYYTNDDIVSLIFVVSTKNKEYTEFYAYNLSKTTGTKVSNDELVKKSKIDENKIKDKISANIENAMEYQNLPTGTNTAFVNQQIMKSQIKYNNVEISDLKMYLNNSCELMVCAEIYPAIEGDMVLTIFNLNRQVKAKTTTKPLQTQDEILNKINELLLDLQTNNDLGPYAQDSKCYYYINNNILSVILECPTENANFYNYYAYNVELSTGKELTNIELLSKMQMTEDDFKEKIDKGIRGLEMYNDYLYGLEFTKEKCESTIEKYVTKNVDDLTLFVNVYGDVTAPIEVYTIVGGEIRTLLLDLKTGKSVYYMSNLPELEEEE